MHGGVCHVWRGDTGDCVAVKEFGSTVGGLLGRDMDRCLGVISLLSRFRAMIDGGGVG